MTSTRAGRTGEKMCGCVVKGVCVETGINANPLSGVGVKDELRQDLEML